MFRDVELREGGEVQEGRGGHGHSNQVGPGGNQKLNFVFRG